MLHTDGLVEGRSPDGHASRLSELAASLGVRRRDDLALLIARVSP